MANWFSKRDGQRQQSSSQPADINSVDVLSFSLGKNSDNDDYGRPFGDQVIQKVASQFKEVVRTGDLAVRIGGEEFAILLEDTGLSGALDVAERLRT